MRIVRTTEEICEEIEFSETLKVEKPNYPPSENWQLWEESMQTPPCNPEGTFFQATLCAELKEYVSVTTYWTETVCTPTCEPPEIPVVGTVALLLIGTTAGIVAAKMRKLYPR